MPRGKSKGKGRKLNANKTIKQEEAKEDQEDEMVIDSKISQLSQEEAVLSELDDILKTSLQTECKKLTLEHKTKLIEFLNSEKSIQSALFEFLQHVCKRVLMYPRSDSHLKPIYRFIAQVFTHFSKTQSLSEDNSTFENFATLVSDLVDFLVRICISGSKTKFQQRAIKILLDILMNLNADQISLLFKDRQPLLDFCLQMCH